MIINRYQLISILIQDNSLQESDREFIASFSDEVLLSIYGKKQFVQFRKGYYII